MVISPDINQYHGRLTIPGGGGGGLITAAGGGGSAGAGSASTSGNLGRRLVEAKLAEADAQRKLKVGTPTRPLFSSTWAVDVTDRLEPPGVSTHPLLTST